MCRIIISYNKNKEYNTTPADERTNERKKNRKIKKEKNVLDAQYIV